MSHHLTKDIVACWLFNAPSGLRLIDSSPYQHNLNYVNTTQQRASYNGQYFDTSIFATTPDTNALRLGAVWTMLLYFKKVESVALKIVLTKGTGADINQYGIRTNGTDDFTVTEGATDRLTISGLTALDNKDTQIAIVSRPGSSEAYVNTISKVTGAQYTSAFMAGVGTVFGVGYSDVAWWGGATGSPKMFWHMIALYKNRALTAKEIMEHYLSPYDMFLR